MLTAPGPEHAVLERILEDNAQSRDLAWSDGGRSISVSVPAVRS